MHEHGIRARHKHRCGVTTDSKHRVPVASNLLHRNFATTAPNQVWTADMTYLRKDEGWQYKSRLLEDENRGNLTHVVPYCPERIPETTFDNWSWRTDAYLQRR